MPLDELLTLSHHYNLSLEEKATLADLCIPELASLRSSVGVPVHNGIPDGVACTPFKWCDSEGICTTVCDRGTVEVDEWFQWASAWERRLSYELPLCYSSLVGAHNAAITLADGYGNEDLYWQSFLKYIPKALLRGTKLVTNNQYLSVTDQLNLGVRLLEVDVHWVQGALRLGHCGGLHSPAFNWLLRALNTLSKLAGQHIRWDTETVGCNPSLSSLPTQDQRHLSDLFTEIAAWMRLPENADEFVVLFYDDEWDLKTWGKVGLLINEMLAAFPSQWILTPAEKAVMFPGAWPSIRQLLNAGKRIMTVSRMDYGAVMHSHIFARHETCGWAEPRLSQLSPVPSCKYSQTQQTSQSGVFYRVNDCKLVYGPLNCQFSPISDMDWLDVLTDDAIKSTTRCAWNSISPDLITPDSLRNAIWSWAPGHPPVAAAAAALGPPQEAARAPRERPSRRSALAAASAQPPPSGADASDCATVSLADGRWRVTSCDADLPAACRAMVPINATTYNTTMLWALGRNPPKAEPRSTNARRDSLWNPAAVSTYVAQAVWRWVAGGRRTVGVSDAGHVESAPVGPKGVCRACCPAGFEFGFPRTPKENEQLIALLEVEDVDGAFLALGGRDYAPL